MNLNMLIHVCQLTKLLGASIEATNKRFLVCMDPQMVKEIVPESEDFVAMRVSAAEQSDDRFERLEASELIDIVSGCFWSILRVNCS